MDLIEFTNRAEEKAQLLAATLTPPLNELLLAYLKRPAELAASKVWANLIYNTALAWQSSPEGVIPLQAATRLFTLAADLLDDVIDGDVATSEEIASHINAGGALINLAQLVLLELPRPLAVISRLNQASLCAFAGQQLELAASASTGQPVNQTPPVPDEKFYMAQAWLKTGGPLAAVCICTAEQGNSISDLEEKSLQEFGLNFGIVLQIKNDLEALKPASTKKSDLDRLKLSLPLIYFQEKASLADYQRVFGTAQNDCPLSRQEFSESLARSGALDYALLLSELHLAQARQALQAIPAGNRLDQLLFESSPL